MKIKGINVWPEAVDEIVLGKDEIIEYQGRLYITPDKREIAEISVEFKADVPQETKQHLMPRIEGELRDRWGIGFKAKEAMEELPRWVTKPRRWTDDRSKGLERKT